MGLGALDIHGSNINKYLLSQALCQMVGVKWYKLNLVQKYELEAEAVLKVRSRS